MKSTSGFQWKLSRIQYPYKRAGVTKEISPTTILGFTFHAFFALPHTLFNLFVEELTYGLTADTLFLMSWSHVIVGSTQIWLSRQTYEFTVLCVCCKNWVTGDVINWRRQFLLRFVHNWQIFIQTYERPRSLISQPTRTQYVHIPHGITICRVWMYHHRNSVSTYESLWYTGRCTAFMRMVDTSTASEFGIWLPLDSTGLVLVRYKTSGSVGNLL